MKTILIPTDFSKNAYGALYYATQLFATKKCKFIIVHSFESQVSLLTSRVNVSKTEAVVEDLYTETETKCEEVKHKIILDTNNKHHSHTTIATSLPLSSAINRLIVKKQVDFVVMGSKGSTGAIDILVGSNTLAMLQKIKKAPLLLVPQEFEYKPIEKIAFATGFKRGFDTNEIQPLTYLLSLRKTIVKVIHVHKKEKLNEEERANFHQLFELLKSSEPENNWLPETTHMYNSILSYLNKEQIDLLAMIYYKHSVIVRWFREATVKNIAKHSLVPFLIIPARD